MIQQDGNKFDYREWIFNILILRLEEYIKTRIKNLIILKLLNYPPCLCLLPRFLPDHLFRIHESKNVETVNYYYCSSINDRNHKSLPTNFSYKFNNDFLSCNDFVSIYTSSSRLFIDQSIKSNIEPSQNQNGWRNSLAASIRSPFRILSLP